MFGFCSLCGLKVAQMHPNNIRATSQSVVGRFNLLIFAPGNIFCSHLGVAVGSAITEFESTETGHVRLEPNVTSGFQVFAAGNLSQPAFFLSRD